MLEFLLDYWQYIIVAIIFIIGTVIKLKKLWKGNIIQWLIDVCAEVEKDLGGGTGFLKLRSAYNEFVAFFPIASKFISFETFSKLVDEALGILKEQIAKNTKINEYVTGETQYLTSDKEGSGNE